MRTKQLAQRWFDEVWNRKNASVIYEMLDAQSVGNTEGGCVTGPERFEKDMFEPLNAAFPDLSVNVDGMIGEGDEVALRWTATGTNTGDLLGIQATGRKVSFSGVTWLRFSGDKLVEGWDRWNLHGLLTLLRQGERSATACWVD